MNTGGLGVVLLVVACVGCGASNHNKMTAIEAPSAEVARLAAAELTIVTTIPPRMKCVEAERTKLVSLASRLETFPECRGPVETLREALANDCAGLVPERTEQIGATFKGCIETVARKSPNMKTILGLGDMSLLLSNAATQLPSTTISENTGQAGVPFETAVLGAVSDFVVSRAKAEILAWIANEFGSALCSDLDDKQISVRSYFPNTCRMFTDSSGEVHADLQAFGSSLQAAIQRDLRDTIGRLINGAVAHSNPRLRVLVAFATSYLSTGDLGSAAAYASTQTPCKNDKATCWLKLGLFVLCQPSLGTFDPTKPDAFIDAVGKTIGASHDDDARTVWEALRKAKDEIRRLIAAASITAKALQSARNLPSPDSIFQAEVGLQSFAAALAQLSLLEGETRVQISEVAAKLTVTREWMDLAAAGYQVVEGIRHGDDPVGMLVAAGRTFHCRMGRDVVCAIRVGFLVVEAITNTSEWNTIKLSDLAAVEAFAAKVVPEFDTRLAALTDDTPRWAALKLSLLPSDKLVLAKSVLQQVRRIGDIVRSEYAPKPNGEPLKRDELKEKTRDLLAATRSVFSLASTLSVRFARQVDPKNIVRAEQLLEDIFAAWTALEERNAGAFVVSLMAAADQLGINALPASIRKYVPLVTAIASAQSSADVKAALEKYAAPVGGYKEKRKRSWMASVTALVGAAGGGERLDHATDGETHGQLGLFAPIGLDVACGKGHWCDGFGLMISILDIGNLLTIRTDKVAAPDPSFRQVFSPGAYLRWNVRGPISIGFGVAAVPELRRPEPADPMADEPTAVGGFKAIGFIAADVTIFPF